MTLEYGATTPPLQMRGADGPRDALAALLVDVLPEKIRLLREAWAISHGELPDIGKVSSGELPQGVVNSLADGWVEIVNPRMLPGLRRVDITSAGDPVYQTRYSCRLYVWALGLDWDMALARRDNLAAAVRQALLEFPTLARAGGDTGWLALEETWSEEYGVPALTENQSGRCWCSAALSVDIRAEEAMSAGRMRPPLGTATSTILAASIVGATEPIPHDLPRPPGWPAAVYVPEPQQPIGGGVTGVDVTPPPATDEQPPDPEPTPEESP